MNSTPLFIVPSVALMNILYLPAATVFATETNAVVLMLLFTGGVSLLIAKLIVIPVGTFEVYSDTVLLYPK